VGELDIEGTIDMDGLEWINVVHDNNRWKASASAEIDQWILSDRQFC
jgi:hypothetical protein